MADVAFNGILTESGGVNAAILLKTAATTITGTTHATAVKVGDEIGGCQGADHIAFPCTIDINAANNVRFVLKGMLETDGTEYVVPWSATQEYFEVLQDEDYSVVPSWTVNKMFPIYQLYAYMGTDGGADPTVAAVYVTISRG